MSSLRRIGCGNFDIIDAVPLESLLSLSSEYIEGNYLIPVDYVFNNYPAYFLSESEEQKIRLGNIISTELPDGLYRVYSTSGAFLILGSADEGYLKIRKNFI